MVDTIATFALTWLYYSSFVAKDLTEQGGRRRMLSPNIGIPAMV